MKEADAESVPRQIGPYRVLHSIARGGTGHVFEVEDPTTGEHLALKLLMHAGSSLARFHREYEAMIRLNHPNIIRVFHFGVFQGLPWQTMELVTGTPVQAYIMRKGRPGDPRRLDEVLRLGHDIASALHHIHRRGLVHRDLKSANLLVLPDGRIKLIDFGSAKVMDGDKLTRDGDFVGTFAYASPEQLVAAPVDGRSDLYSLGVLLYRLCTGRRPFEHDDPTTLARMHLKEPVVPPRDLFASIPTELNDLILDLLAKRRDQRPATGKAVARRFEQMAGRPLVLPGTLELEDTANRMVGRESQQEALRAFLQSGVSGSLAVVSGVEGSGRNAVLSSASADARDHGYQVWRCVMSPGKDVVSITVLLRQMLEALPDSRTPTLERARNLLENLGLAWDVRSAHRRESLQQAGIILLRASADQAGNPILLVVDGLHHAGPVVLEWLQTVKAGLSRTQTPVLILTTLDPGEDRTNYPASERFSEDLWIRLDPLDAHRVGLLVGALLHRRPPPPVLAARIHEASGGLPVYVEDVVRQLVKRGLLQEQDRDPNRLEWAQREEEAIPVPPEARDLVLHALRPLPAIHRRALSALSLLDDGATVRDVASGMGFVIEEAQGVIAELRERGWLEPGDDGPSSPVRWRQILARAVVRSSIEPTRVRVYERLLAHALASERPSLSQVRLLLAVGRVDEAIESAAGQAEELLLSGAPRSALELLDPVVRDVKAARRTPRDALARLFLLHARALVEVRPLDPKLQPSLRKAETLGTGDLFRAEVQLVHSRLQRRIGHLANERKHLGEAWTAAQHGDPTSAISVPLAVDLGMSSLRAGQSKSASRWFHQALRVGQTRNDRRLVALAEAGLAALRYSKGDLTSAEMASIAAIDLFDKLSDAEGIALAAPVWADVLRQQGRFSEAIQMIGRALPSFRRLQSPAPYAHLLVSMAWLEVELCRLGRAQECVDELAATVSETEQLTLRVLSKLAWGRILLASDQLGQAARLLGDVCNVATSAGLLTIAEQARALLAETLWQAGQQDEARKLFVQAMAQARALRDVPTLLEVCRCRGRVAAEIADPDELFSPVRDHLAKEPAEVARLEWTLAAARHRAHLGLDAEPVWLEARRMMRDMARRLSDVDQAALRVHPWARELRARLKDEPLIPAAAPPPS